MLRDEVTKYLAHGLPGLVRMFHECDIDYMDQMLEEANPVTIIWILERIPVSERRIRATLTTALMTPSATIATG